MATVVELALLQPFPKFPVAERYIGGVHFGQAEYRHAGAVDQIAALGQMMEHGRRGGMPAESRFGREFLGAEVLSGQQGIAQ